MMEAVLRLWVDHPYHARFLDGPGGVHRKVQDATTVAEILEHMERDGWTVEHKQDDGSEICWIAYREFKTVDQAILACKARNPLMWGTFLVGEQVIW